MNRSKKNGLNGNQIKILGTVLMVFDHLAAFLVLQTPIWFGWLGRPVAILFLFLSSEGFTYTKNKLKYAGLLLGGFWIMSFGNWLFGTLFVVEGVELYANIFGTLFFGVLYMVLWDLLKAQIIAKHWRKALGVLLLALLPFAESLLVLQLFSVNLTFANILFKTVPTLLVTEGGILYVAMALAFYIARDIKWVKYAVIAAFSAFALASTVLAGQNILMEGYEWMAIFSMIPLYLYNGKKGNGHKYFFYIFYPAHIFLIYMVSFLIQTFS